MSAWTRGQRVAFDLETTDRIPQNARIVTASVILVDADGTKARENDWLINPGVEIPEETVAIHGVTTEHARTYGLEATVGLTDIYDVLQAASAKGIPIVGHNVSYDLTVLACELARHGLDGNVHALGPIIDTYVLDKAVDTYRAGKRTLTTASQRYGVELSEEDAHNASADAYASERIATAIAAQYPEVDVEARTLHGWQVKWAARQAASLQAHFRKKDPTAFVDPLWPVKHLQLGETE